MVIDIDCIKEFCGHHLRDVGRNRQLRDPDVNKLLETTGSRLGARTKVARYREAYANQGTAYASLPCDMSTSGKIHGKFLRLAHRRTLKHYVMRTWGKPSQRHLKESCACLPGCCYRWSSASSTMVDDEFVFTYINAQCGFVI